jgi:hypothetical protein
MNRLEIIRRESEISKLFKEEKIEDLLFEFLKERTPTTERAYKKDLRHFFAYCKDEFRLPCFKNSQLGFDQIKRIHIVKYKV